MLSASLFQNPNYPPAFLTSLDEPVVMNSRKLLTVCGVRIGNGIASKCNSAQGSGVIDGTESFGISKSAISRQCKIASG